MPQDPFISSIYELLRTLDTRDQNASACYGVTRLQGFVLLELLHASDLSMQELSDRMRLSVSTMTRVLDKLVAAGLVGRIRSRDDRRIVLCALTGKGKTTGKKLERCYKDFYNRIVSELSAKEQKTFIKAIQKTIHLIRDDGEACG